MKDDEIVIKFDEVERSVSVFASMMKFNSAEKQVVYLGF